MKDFFKYVLATITGIFVCTIIGGFFFFISLLGIIASTQAEDTQIKDNSVLVINLYGMMEETDNSNPLGVLLGNTVKTMSLESTLKAIQKAKENEKIKGIYIEAGLFSSDIATAQELRNTLEDFKKAGKWIIAYGETYTQLTYYIASVANKIYINPEGALDWHGLSSQNIFLKDLLNKFGIKMQVFKVGKFKSATEMFTEDKMSYPNKEQTQKFINGIWNNICQAVAKSRKISIDSLNNYADKLTMFDGTEALKKKKFIDGTFYTDQIAAVVKKALKIKEEDKINQVSLSTVLNDNEQKNGDKIAVYYAFGDIVNSESEGKVAARGNKIVAQTVCQDLKKIMDDKDVKAVVIRVNSGGGSAYASEQMWHQITELKKKKPVIISMGGMAASGGYYMSCNANYIFAEPTTLTGSIGIFGIFPDFSQLLTEKLGVKFDEVKTNKNSSIGSMGRPINPEEAHAIQMYINRGYKLFVKRVANGRNLPTQKVEEIAQGHVYLGQDAIKLKLVDELGGIKEAVAKAAQMAKIKQYYTKTYPETQGFLTSIIKSTSNTNYLDEQLYATLNDFYTPFLLIKNIKSVDPIQARIPFYMNIK